MPPSKVFRVTGTFHATHHDQNFSKEVVAATADGARERILATFGSKHRVPRRLIRIVSVTEVPLAQVEDPVVRHLAGA